MDIISPLRNPTFRYLFLGQAFSLVGTGLTTVALALLAFDLDPHSAGWVLGIALSVKMLAYLCVAPVVGGYVSYLPRKYWLAGLNVGRAVIVSLLPFCSEVWQFMLLMFLMNALAAGYTPVYQALLPDVLPDEQEYTKALSLSRLMMELESFLSPALAAFVLIFFSYSLLFNLNAVGFLIGVAFLLMLSLPKNKTSDRGAGVWQHISFGMRSYMKTPRLKATLLLNLALSSAGAMTIVNTVVYVRSVLGLSEERVPLLMLSVGAGAILTALLLVKLLDTFTDRIVMLSGGMIMTLALMFGLSTPGYSGLYPIWFFIGVGSSLVLIPTGRVVRNSCQERDRNDFFSANFALTHGMWFVAYLLAGWLGKEWGMAGAFAGLAALCSLATFAAASLWKSDDQEYLWHEHHEVDHSHPHTHDKHHQHTHEGWEGPEPHIHPHYHEKKRHKHKFVIDEHHIRWPKG